MKRVRLTAANLCCVQATTSVLCYRTEAHHDQPAAEPEPDRPRGIGPRGADSLGAEGEDVVAAITRASLNLRKSLEESRAEEGDEGAGGTFSA
eukprot:COSAG01_NODE_2433_length_7703_cov_64.622173_10_plen_93_part_00